MFLSMAGCLDAPPDTGSAELELRARSSDGVLSHERHQQMHRGVPVEGGSVAMVRDGQGRVLGVLDRTRRDLDLDVTPHVTARAAERVAENELGVVGPYETTSRLVIETDPAPRLAWRVETAPAGGDPDDLARELSIDAQTGAILGSRPLVSYDTGKSEYSGTVSVTSQVATLPLCGTSRFLADPGRALVVGLEGSGAPFRSNGTTWGDGHPIPPGGYVASGGVCDPVGANANAQTAAVDAMHGWAIGFDMYGKVFAQDGIDGNGGGTTILVHGHDPSSKTDSHQVIHLTDTDDPTVTTPHTDVGTTVHEMTHAVQNSIGLKADDGLKEGISNIMAAFAIIWDRHGGFASGRTTIPDTTNPDELTLRYNLATGQPVYQDSAPLPLYQPSKTESKNEWHAGLESDPAIDEHTKGLPVMRAAYFLAQGSSAHVDSNSQVAFRSHTQNLPWGMTGVGNDLAAHDLYWAFFDCLSEVATAYENARECAIFYGGFHGITAAVQNAFAGIKVGALAPSYPAPPPTQHEQEPNEHADEAGNMNPLTWTRSPAGYESMSKAWVDGSLGATASDDADTFKFTLGCAARLGVLLDPSVAGAPVEVVLYDAEKDVIASDPSQLSYARGSLCSIQNPSATFYVKVRSTSPLSGTVKYKLFLDTY